MIQTAVGCNDSQRFSSRQVDHGHIGVLETSKAGTRGRLKADALLWLVGNAGVQCLVRGVPGATSARHGVVWPGGVDWQGVRCVSRNEAIA
jgi:hypothetical protein